MNGWHSAAVIYKEEKGRFYFLVQDVVSTDPRWSNQPPQTKCVGGGREPGEDNPEATVMREISQELAEELEVNGGKIELRSGVVLRRVWVNKKDNHTQFFFLIWFEDLLGPMRRANVIRRDGDSALSNLRFLDESEVEDVIFRTHQPAIAEAINYLHNLHHKSSTLVG